MGGEHSQLAKILNKDSTGQYYALTCSLTAMDQCVKAASGLLDYAKDNFSKQFSFQNNTGLTPLGIAFSQYNPIEYIGLIPPVSLVTPEVVQYRDELASRLKENEYYQQKFYPFFNKGYPVELHANFINNANLILSQANSNVQILMQPHGGAADCFNFPDKCKNIKAGIDSQLHNITINDLKFLEDMKYTITVKGGMFYNTGEGLTTSWRILPDESGGPILVKANDINVTDTQYLYETDICIPGMPGAPSSYIEYKYITDKVIDGGMKYKGTLFYDAWHADWCHKVATNQVSTSITGWVFRVEIKQISPFFFETFNITEWCD